MVRRKKEKSPVEVERPGRVPIHWDPTSDPTYREFMKSAKVAGKKGVPDPSRTTEAPSCFHARHALAQDQLHHEMGALLEEIEPLRKLLVSFAHVLEEVAATGSMTEAQERRLVQHEEAKEQIRSRVQRSEARMRAIIAVHDRCAADMREVYRRHYPFADHFDLLVFPVLDLRDLRYDDDDDPGFGAMMPSRPTRPGDRPAIGARKGEIA